MKTKIIKPQGLVKVRYTQTSQRLLYFEEEIEGLFLKNDKAGSLDEVWLPYKPKLKTQTPSQIGKEWILPSSKILLEKEILEKIKSLKVIVRYCHTKNSVRMYSSKGYLILHIRGDSSRRTPYYWMDNNPHNTPYYWIDTWISKAMDDILVGVKEKLKEEGEDSSRPKDITLMPRKRSVSLPFMIMQGLELIEKERELLHS